MGILEGVKVSCETLCRGCSLKMLYLLKRIHKVILDMGEKFAVLT